MCRIISKYSNRRIYDTHDHKYITMNDLRDLIKSGIDFKVLEISTNRDITKETLLKILIINDDILTIDILKDIISSNNGNFKAKLTLMITKTLKYFLKHRHKYLLI